MKLPIKTAKLSLSGDYEGWECTVRTNPPLRVFRMLQSDLAEDVIAALAVIILDWNFVDEEGNPLPPPDEAGVEALPLDLVDQIGRAYTEEIVTLPKRSSGRS